jgi:hypothetical protein
MTFEDYQSKVKQLESDFEALKTDYMRDFVIANNPYKKGDIVTDHIGTIKIESMRFSWGGLGRQPCAIYYGVELKKNGEPKKNGNKRDVYQSNVLSIIAKNPFSSGRGRMSC